MRSVSVAGNVQGKYEVAIPRAIASIDGVFDLGELGGFFGPVEPWLARREVGIEAYSGTLPVEWFADACFKASWLVKRWLKSSASERHGSRPPVLLVVSNRRYPARIRAGLSECIAPGIWRVSVAEAVELVLIELAVLPLENGTTGLHMLRRPSDHEGARVLEAFLNDETVSPALRARFEEAIMNQTIPTTDTEHMTAAQRVRYEGRAEGRMEGRVEGRAEGRAEGRQAVIRRVRLLLGDEAARTLDGIEDLDELQARAFELVAERR